ncbi:MAG TPA: MBL fold metallo-hydrolase [Microbacteriaceae bacterium]|nr:MBL fold metallo-hydrolase [Microbacteriaceae bacterium]
MHLLKLEHSALVVSNGTGTLYVDPGSFTRPVPVPNGPAAVVISHEHADHWTPQQLDRILGGASGPVPIIGPEGVARAAHGYDVTVARAGESLEASGFTLRFFGGRHAVIHRSIPVVDNLAVLVDGLLFHPGDSFTVPDDTRVDTLAVPASAPWLKASEFMDYVLAVRPKRSFAMHECINSEAGNRMAFERIKTTTEAGGGTFLPLRAGDETDL